MQELPTKGTELLLRNSLAFWCCFSTIEPKEQQIQNFM